MQRRSCSVPAAAKSVIAVIGVMLTLVCCSTPWDPDTDGNAVACRSTYNFRPGTSEFDQCRGSRKLMPEKKNGLSVERVNQRFTVQPSIGK
jgi:hypothetical protein